MGLRKAICSAVDKYVLYTKEKSIVGVMVFTSRGNSGIHRSKKSYERAKGDFQKSVVERASLSGRRETQCKISKKTVMGQDIERMIKRKERKKKRKGKEGEEENNYDNARG